MKAIEPIEIIYSVMKIPNYPVAAGEINGYEYAILNYGYNPAAYVNIPDGHSLRGNRKLIETSIRCHGGVTFLENFRSPVTKSKYPHLYDLFGGKALVVGWDYAHLGDYMPSLMGAEIRGKMWRTEEIMAEVKNVINQLKLLEGNNE